MQHNQQADLTDRLYNNLANLFFYSVISPQVEEVLLGDSWLVLWSFLAGGNATTIKLQILLVNDVMPHLSLRCGISEKRSSVQNESKFMRKPLDLCLCKPIS